MYPANLRSPPWVFRPTDGLVPRQSAAAGGTGPLLPLAASRRLYEDAKYSYAGIVPSQTRSSLSVEQVDMEASKAGFLAAACHAGNEDYL